ncbi:MAG: hypothetical protein FWD23_18095, partial [Oscillospiraceae bacterium]|nr:hypothetical protein [Oscillospiraceae bacterium]
ALFSCVLFLTKSKALLPAGIISFTAAFILNEDIITAFASLIYIIAGALIYFGVRSKRKQNRTQITVRISVALAVFYLLLLAVSFMMSAGTFYNGMTALVSDIDSELTAGTEAIVNQFSAYSDMTDAEKADYVKELVINMKAILPACFILYSLFTAYLATALFKPAYNIFIPLAYPGRKRIKNKYWRINISTISAIIMILSVFLAVMASGGDNILASIVLTNLIIILIPGFCVTGIYFTFDNIFRSGAGFLPVMLAVGTVMLAFIFPFAIIVTMIVLIISGLYASLIGDIKKLYEKMKKMLLGDGDDDDDDYID